MSATKPQSHPGPKFLFSELPISKATLRGLDENKWISMTPIQRASIPHILSKKDVLGTALTGSGKSLAFVVPILENLYREKWSSMDGLGCLIIIPTRELGIQLFDTLTKVGKYHNFSAGLIIGGKDFEFEKRNIAELNILIATPGRLLQHLQQTPDFVLDHVQMLVMDEADRILEMGFTETINQVIEYLPEHRQTLLFSATLSKSIQSLSRLSLKEYEYINVLPNNEDMATKKKLMQYYIEIDLENKFNLLFSFIKSHLKQKTIVFLSSCKQVRFVYESFKILHPGVQIMEIHGKQKQSKRTAIYFSFMEKTEAVLFSTDIAARGLDFPAVNWVVQVDCPEDVESYIHRVGRTARYKSGGNSLIMLLPTEIKLLEMLEKKGVTLKKLTPNATKTYSITSGLQGIIAENKDIKHLAERAFVSYIRSIFLMPNKEMFNVQVLPLKKFAESFGLMSVPELSIKQVETNTMTKLQKLREKIKLKKAGMNEIKEEGEGKIEEEDLFRVKLTAEPEEDLRVSEDSHNLLPEIQKKKISGIEFSKGEEDISNRIIYNAKSTQYQSIIDEKNRIKANKIKIKLKARAREPIDYIEESDEH